MNYKECTQFLKERNNYLILTHTNPDGDTAGSAAALCSTLRRAGKKAYLYPNPQFSDKLKPYVSAYLAGEDYKYSTVVAVDVAEKSMFPQGFEGEVDLCIDHHPSNTMYAGETLLAADKAACGEIVLRLIKTMGLKLTKNEANLLYIAISTDTGCFLYSNTKAETFAAASELLKAGADNSGINLAFFRKVSAQRLKLEGMIYDSLKFYREGKIAIATVTQRMLEESGASEDDLDDIASLAGRAKDAVVSVTVREKPDGECRVSVRTGKGVNSSDICAVFGGGGHTSAAGCCIKATADKASKMILDVINEVWK